MAVVVALALLALPQQVKAAESSPLVLEKRLLGYICSGPKSIFSKDPNLNLPIPAYTEPAANSKIATVAIGVIVVKGAPKVEMDLLTSCSGILQPGECGASWS